jgi:hypothetical protein
MKCTKEQNNPENKLGQAFWRGTIPAKATRLIQPAF